MSSKNNKSTHRKQHAHDLKREREKLQKKQQRKAAAAPGEVRMADGAKRLRKLQRRKQFKKKGASAAADAKKQGASAATRMELS